MVGVAGGGGPVVRAVGVAADSVVGVGLGAVVVPASGAEVAGGGGSVWVRDDVVEVARAGGGGAAGGGAGGVAPAHGGGEFRGGVAAEFGDVEQGAGGGGEQSVQAGVGVGDQVSDGVGGDDAGAVGELSWGVGGAEQGWQRNDDADGDLGECAGGAVAEAGGDQDGAEFCAVGSGAVADAEAGERQCGRWQPFGRGGSPARLPAVGRGCRRGGVRRRPDRRPMVGLCPSMRDRRSVGWCP